MSHARPRAMAGPIPILALLLGAPDASSTPQPAIEAMVAQVSEAEASQVVADLAAFGTRYSGTPGCDQASDYLLARLQAAGLPARKDSFSWGATTLANVVARKVGVVRPGEIYLLVAHYDSTSESPLVSAPGADDDASGCAAVLEAARVLAEHEFEATIDFVLTGGEEQGLLGSEADAAAREALGEQVAGVVNHDMIGYWPSGWARDLDVDGVPESARIVDAYVQAATDYVPAMPVDGRLDWGVCGDDQVSYHVRSYPSIIVMDCYEAHLGMGGETTPHYHRTTDTVATLDLARMTDVIRATTATAAVLAVPITRSLYRNDDMPGAGYAGAVLRPGDPSGTPTSIDPAAAGTTRRPNPGALVVYAGDGEWAGPGTRGSFVFYESDRDEILTLSRSDADADGRLDVLVALP